MSGPSSLAAEVPGPRGPRGRCGGRCGAPCCRCKRGDPGSAVWSTPLWAGPRASSANARRWEGGIPFSPLPSPSPTRTAPRCSCGACPGHGPVKTWVFIRQMSAPPQVAPQEPGISSVTHGTPLVSPGRRGIGLHPDLGKCLQFFLSELRALCPPIRFLRGTGCILRLGIQPSSVEREGFPHLGSSVLLPSRNPPFRMVPRLFRSALFPGRVSLPLGSPVCPARLIPLRCIWVMSLSSAIGSCCRAWLPRWIASRFVGVSAVFL